MIKARKQRTTLSNQIILNHIHIQFISADGFLNPLKRPASANVMLASSAMKIFVHRSSALINPARLNSSAHTSTSGTSVRAARTHRKTSRMRLVISLFPKARTDPQLTSTTTTSYNNIPLRARMMAYRVSGTRTLSPAVRNTQLNSRVVATTLIKASELHTGSILNTGDHASIHLHRSSLLQASPDYSLFVLFFSLSVDHLDEMISYDVMISISLSVLPDISLCIRICDFDAASSLVQSVPSRSTHPPVLFSSPLFFFVFVSAVPRFLSRINVTET